MWTLSVRVGAAELVTLAGGAIVAVLFAVAFLDEWVIALVPGLTYALAIGVAYGIYRRYARERAAAKPAATVVAFRVVETRGVCPLGRQTGDLVTVGAAGGVAPGLCPQAEAVLRLAASGEEDGAREWCCPIYEHLLVFRRELKVAA